MEISTWKQLLRKTKDVKTSRLEAEQGYDSHSPLDGVCDEQTSGGVNLLVLLLDVLGDLLQHLPHRHNGGGGSEEDLGSHL